ncbi:MAG: hypothetical protein WCK65_14095 [Rhodospirillaceae bacterium]
MNTFFASNTGFVRNTAVVDSRHHTTSHHTAPVAVKVPQPATVTGSGLGGEIGRLAAALETVGWNHNQVPLNERLPPDEREAELASYRSLKQTGESGQGSGLGGQIAELTAALETVGWSHNQAPLEDLAPLPERN